MKVDALVKYRELKEEIKHRLMSIDPYFYYTEMNKLPASQGKVCQLIII